MALDGFIPSFAASALIVGNNPSGTLLGSRWVETLSKFLQVPRLAVVMLCSTAFQYVGHSFEEAGDLEENPSKAIRPGERSCCRRHLGDRK